MKDAEFDYRKFRQGIILFNSAEFFKAHEVWEELWLACPGGLVAAEADKLFLQGMIQIAAAFHHYTRGNFKGARSLLEEGLKKLRTFPSEYRGTDLNTLRGAADGWLEGLARGRDPSPDDVPRIEFVDQDY